MLAIETAGNGVPLVFLHAFPLTRRMWSAQSAALSRNFKTVLIDFPGFGDSPEEGDTLSLDDFADRVLAALEANGVKDPFVLAGLSMGGYVAFRLLEKAPQKVRALVLASTRAAADTDVARERRFKNIEIVRQHGVEPLIEMMKPTLLGKTALATRPDLVRLVAEDIRRGTAAGVCAALRGMAERPDSTPLLKSIHVPVLVLSGTEDVVIPSAEMEAMAGALENSEFHAIPAAGHLLNLEAPDVFRDRFLHFLKRRVL